MRGDIADPDVVGLAMEGCDAVVNFAAETHVDRSLLGDARSSKRTSRACSSCSKRRAAGA